LNPLAVEVMREIGIDISRKSTRGVLDLLRAGREFDWVVMVCDEASAQKCPFFPGGRQTHWSLPDPSGFQGSHEEKLAATREVRERLRTHIEEFVRNTAPA